VNTSLSREIYFWGLDNSKRLYTEGITILCSKLHFYVH